MSDILDRLLTDTNRPYDLLALRNTESVGRLQRHKDSGCRGKFENFCLKGDLVRFISKVRCLIGNSIQMRVKHWVASGIFVTCASIGRRLYGVEACISDWRSSLHTAERFRLLQWTRRIEERRFLAVDNQQNIYKLFTDIEPRRFVNVRSLITCRFYWNRSGQINVNVLRLLLHLKRLHYGFIFELLDDLPFRDPSSFKWWRKRCK